MINWRPNTSLEILKLRARMLQSIRAFFFERGVMEVETPLLSSAATTDPALASLVTHYSGPVFPRGQTLYLHTSPEFPMKRLLAAGSGPIFQLCKVFRDGEAGRLHNPEFTMLEWYRTGFDHHQLMTEVDDLARAVLGSQAELASTERLTYREAFLRFVDIDPFVCSKADLAARAMSLGVEVTPELRAQPESAWRDLLLSHVVEPRLGQDRPTFLYDYPASQASLARVVPGNPPLAARFELYLNGIELANGFHELADAPEQRKRFEAQQYMRAESGLPEVPMDERLLAALAAGFPDCAGVALGFDRLVMVAAGAASIQDAIPFPVDHA
jgi:elongation factor P--(R)-beta-lysine ligase